MLLLFFYINKILLIKVKHYKAKKKQVVLDKVPSLLANSINLQFFNNSTMDIHLTLLVYYSTSNAELL